MADSQGPDFLVEIEPFDDLWMVVWRVKNRPYRRYFVNAADLQRTSTEIRGLLGRLVGDSTKGALVAGNRASVAPVLGELMACGHKLYRQFFRDAKETNLVTPDIVKADLAAHKGRPTICFKVNAKVHIPWALMAETPAPDPQGAGGVGDYRSFWALRYSVATLYDPLLSAEVFHGPYQAQDFDALIGMDPVFKAKATAQLKPTDPEAALFSMLEQRYPPAFTDSQSLLAAWQTREPRLGLLYLYCHSSDRRVGFSAADVIDTIDFKLDYMKPTTPPRCLVFLNGCHTAAGEFLEATGRDGFCGFIGTETVLPYMFGHRFGAAVIASLYAGEPLGAIIDRLREQHWPLSLVYGLYAFPFLQLVPCFALPKLPDHNYSDLDVGDQTI